MDLQKTKYFLEQFVLSAFKKEIRTVVKFLLIGLPTELIIFSVDTPRASEICRWNVVNSPNI